MRQVFPQPGFTEADLDDLLASRQFIFADCYTFTLITGEVLRYTTAQYDVSLIPIEGGPVVTYQADAVLVGGLRFKIGIGVELDEQSVKLAYSADTLVRETTFAQALRRGDFDGARITRDRYYAESWRTAFVGGMRLFSGRCSDLQGVGRTEGVVNVKSDLVLLDQPTPRNLWQPSCIHTLFDSGCKLVKSAYAVAGLVEAGSTSTKIVWAGATPDYTAGTIYLESGDGLTFSRTIRVATNDELFMAFPFPFTPTPGADFTAYIGCVRTYQRCGELGNQVNFRGFPFVPKAETAY